MRPDSDIWLRQYFVDRLGALDRERAEIGRAHV